MTLINSTLIGVGTNTLAVSSSSWSFHNIAKIALIFIVYTTRQQYNDKKVAEERELGVNVQNN